ncbi:MAG: sulfatase [Acidobacteria bacterium]|nr:sulfatase [Acidobacteriota bacterium]
MKRREFLKTTTGAVAAHSLTPMWAKASTSHPNLLFITVDDMNWDMPGFMGNTLGLTPHLDQLASRSHRFMHNRTTAPICQPSREAMMTGRVPHRSGALGFDPIHEGIPTLVMELRKAGYFTGSIHKQEHMQPPSCFPWDYSLEGKGRAPSEYGNAVTHAIAAARTKKQPFFINCNINDPHRPFYGSRGAAAVDHNETGEYHVAREVTANDITVPVNLEPLPAVREEYAQYCNSAQRMDKSIGAVLAALAAAPESEHTIIFFSADHGMPFPFAKATVYNNGTRTPALLHYPHMSTPKAFEERTCNIDYMPTLLDLLGVPQPAGMDGKSWAPLLHGGKYDGPNLLVTHVNTVHSLAAYPMRAIQDDRYSLVFTPWSDGKLLFSIESMTGLTYPAMHAAAKTDPAIAARVQQLRLGIPLAFYDLKEDPGQRKNLIDAAAHKNRIAHMKKALLQYIKETGDPQLDNFQRLLAGKPMHVEQVKRANG